LKKLGFSSSREVKKRKTKSPTFWDADFVRKSRAFGSFAKKKSPTFWKRDAIFYMKITTFLQNYEIIYFSFSRNLE